MLICGCYTGRDRLIIDAMGLRNSLFTLFRRLLIVSASLALVIAALDYLNLTLAFDSAKPALTTYLKSYTGRDVRIDGDIELTISLPISLMSGRIHIAGPDGFDNNDDFITVNEIQVAVALLPLLSGKPAFREISADKAEIRLTRKKDGSNNWTFTPASVATGADENTIADKSSAGQSSTDMRRPSIDKFQLTNVTVLYNDERRDHKYREQVATTG